MFASILENLKTTASLILLVGLVAVPAAAIGNLMRLRPHTGLVAKALLFAVVFIGYGITIDVCWRFVGLPAWMGWIDPKSTDLINTEIVSSGNSNADISASNSLVKALINICLQTSADLSKIETTAEQFKWQRTN